MLGANFNSLRPGSIQRDFDANFSENEYKFGLDTPNQNRVMEKGRVNSDVGGLAANSELLINENPSIKSVEKQV